MSPSDAEKIRRAGEALTREACVIAASEPILKDICKRYVIDRATLGEGISYMLADEFGGPDKFDQWYEVIHSVYKGEYGPYHDESMGSVELLAALDLLAVAERDPANESGELLTPYLHFKGFKAIQAHRVSHNLWRNGR